MSELIGLIYKIKATQKLSEKFSKREVIILTAAEQYPQHILFEATGDKTSLLDDYQENDEVKIFYNMRGRLWTSPEGEEKCFNTNSLWKIELINKGLDVSEDSLFRPQHDVPVNKAPDPGPIDDLPW